MTRVVRIFLIILVVTSGTLLLLRIPVTMPTDDSVQLPSAKDLPREVTITLAQVPSVAASSATAIEEPREEVPPESVIEEEMQPTDDDQPHQERKMMDRWEAITHTGSFIPDVTIASVKANQTLQKSDLPKKADHTYVSLQQVTEAPRFDHKLLSSRIQYPQGAKRQGVEATVVLRLYIGDDGAIRNVIVEEDPGLGFATAAMDAFFNMVVEPAKIDGRAVAVTMLFPITFSLE
jgi:protein TonB